MPKTSKELLDSVERPSSLDTLLLGLMNPTPQTLESKQQTCLNLKERPSFNPPPKSQVLGKVKEFLGIMAKANQDLELRTQEKQSSDYDIEVLNDDDEEFIEMDLLLGVADLQSEEAIAAAEASMSGFQPTQSSMSSYYSDGEYCNADEFADDGYKKNNAGVSTIKSSRKPTKHDAVVKELSRDAKQSKRPKVIMLG